MKKINKKLIVGLILIIIIAVLIAISTAYYFYVYLDSKKIIGNQQTNTCCQPKCKAIGTKSEGWYDCNEELIKFELCKDKKAICQFVDSKSEGWYGPDDLIEYEDCSSCDIKEQKTSSTKISAIKSFLTKIKLWPESTSNNERQVSHFGVQGLPILFPDKVKEAGVDIVRVWIEWDKIEPSNNNYQWSEMDAMVKAARQNNIEVLGYFISMPIWARDTSDPKCGQAGKKMGDICTPKDWSDYEEFAQKVAERYDGKHGNGEIKYIGIWNEVQLFSAMTAEEYAPWLTKGYAAIKRGNPNALVNIGSFVDPFEFDDCDSSGKTQGICSADFIDAFLKDYSNYFDVVDFHVYRKEVGVTETSAYIKERMSNYGLDKPMWITETATNLATLPCDLNWYDDIAVDVPKRYVRAFSEGVDKVFWFAFVTNPTQQEDPKGMKCGGASNFNMGSLGWGLKDSIEYHPRPAYTAYQTMTEKLSDFTEVEKLSDSQYKFKVNNKSVYVLWCDSGSCSVPSEISGQVKVTDYLGNEEIINANQLNLNENPIFVDKI